MRGILMLGLLAGTIASAIPAPGRAQDPAAPRAATDLPPLPDPPPPTPGGPSPPTSPTGAPGASRTPIEAADLARPFGLSPGGGGAPTLEGQEPSPRSFVGPGLLDRALGLEESRIDFYGWIQNSFTGNTNGTPPSGENFGLYPNHLANQWMGNQYYLVAERASRAGRGIDWGFRFDTLFGNDWQFTKMYGVFDNAFKPLSFRGLDLPQFYGELHLPVLTEGGLDVKFGRWYSIAGYESVMATQRPLLSWPYIFTYFPFTFSGVMTTFRATDRLNIFNGAAPGVDRFFNENYIWTYIGGIGWTSKDGRTSATLVLMNGPNQLPRFLTGETTFGTFVPTNITPPPFLAGRRNPGYAENDRTITQNVLTHKWTDRLTQAFEFSYAFEPNTPAAGPGGTSADTTWYGGANWFLYDLNEQLTAVWRTEVFHDGSPFLTGASDTYYAFTFGALWKPREWLWARPEARYDWAQFGTPFGDGTRGDRFAIGFDVIVLF